MSSPIPKPHREVLDYLRSVGALQVHIEPGAKHVRAVFVWQERQFFFPLPSNETLTSVVAAKSDLNYLLGLVGRKKRVGARRSRPLRRDSRLAVNWRSPATPINFPPDWHRCLFDHPTSVAMLRGRLELAWRAWWREQMARQGGESRL